ncbi:hypothetical protein ONZ43_g3565 [Nemania bipapillata]|uniref:Uncharacterized protein n=1 Tax=Nemania bipapillata TaxID=110536 RepID=A0ACC2IWP0_9PEZI|nr:hypothetical protein ONZ43_g3565 [Nemania bipapillata]
MVSFTWNIGQTQMAGFRQALFDDFFAYRQGKSRDFPFPALPFQGPTPGIIMPGIAQQAYPYYPPRQERKDLDLYNDSELVDEASMKAFRRLRDLKNYFAEERPEFVYKKCMGWGGNGLAAAFDVVDSGKQITKFLKSEHIIQLIYVSGQGLVNPDITLNLQDDDNYDEDYDYDDDEEYYDEDEENEGNGNYSNRHYERMRKHGKRYFYAPEQFTVDWDYIPQDQGMLAGQPVAGNFGPQTNIFAFGLTMETLITHCHPAYPPTPTSTSRLPPAGKTEYWTYAAHLEQDVYSYVDRDIIYLIQRLQAHYPEDRPTLHEIENLVTTAYARSKAGGDKTQEELKQWVQKILYEPAPETEGGRRVMVPVMREIIGSGFARPSNQHPK